MIYRIYVDGQHGKELLCVTGDLIECLRVIDNIINSTPNKQLLVIRHNIDLDMDEVIIAYYGHNIDRYNEDKTKLLYEYAYAKRRKQLTDISNDVLDKFGKGRAR